MSTVTAPPRHALGWPAGSVRATHLLVITLILTLALVIPGRGGVYLAFPPYLIYLLFLILGHYFAARGQSGSASGQHAPLYLPRGFIRLIVVAALGAAVIYRMVQNPDKLRDQLSLSLDALKDYPVLPLYILIGFLAGSLLRSVVGRDNPTQWLQDLEAWLSLIGLVGLAISAVVHLIVNPSVNPENAINIPVWDEIMATLVAFYFGARS